MMFLEKGAVVQHVESRSRAYQFESNTCYNDSTIGEEGACKPQYMNPFPWKKFRALSLVSAKFGGE